MRLTYESENNSRNGLFQYYSYLSFTAGEEASNYTVAQSSSKETCIFNCIRTACAYIVYDKVSNEDYQCRLYKSNNI